MSFEKLLGKKLKVNTVGNKAVLTGTTLEELPFSINSQENRCFFTITKEDDLKRFNFEGKSQPKLLLEKKQSDKTLEIKVKRCTASTDDVKGKTFIVEGRLYPEIIESNGLKIRNNSSSYTIYGITEPIQEGSVMKIDLNIFDLSYQNIVSIELSEFKKLEADPSYIPKAIFWVKKNLNLRKLDE